jgi:hypothetical protein
MTANQTEPLADATARRGNDESWASPVDRLALTHPASGGVPATVVGRRVAGPIQGFGQMWQKTFRVRLPAHSDLTPQQVVAIWKEEFPTFWPKGNTFYAPLAGIQPGEVALLSASVGGVRMHTGVLVLYADDVAFTLMTPEGHMLAAWITFSAFRAPDGTVVAQAQALERASDPLFEMGLMLGGHGINNRFWTATLGNLARRFGSPTEVETEVVCVDKRRQWRQIGNVRHNAGFRSMLYMAGAPLRWVRRRS